MVQTQKVTGRAVSMPLGLLLGVLCSLTLTILCAAILAKLIETETIPENGIGYGVMLILIISSFLGAMVAFKKIKRQRMLVCLAAGFLFFMVLLSITALFFGGQYEAVGVTALLVLCGSGLAALLGLHENRGGKRRKVKFPNR